MKVISSQKMKQEASIEHFYAHAIVDKDNEPLHDLSVNGVTERDLERIVDIYNDAARMGADVKAPYRVVKLYFKD